MGCQRREERSRILMLRLGFPEFPGRRDLRNGLAGPQAGGVDVRDRVLGHPFLRVVDVVDRRAVARAHVVALAVRGAGIVDLEEELQQLAVAHLRGIEDHLDAFGMGAVVAVGGVRHVAAGVADPRRLDPGHLADQVLHAPETSAS